MMKKMKLLTVTLLLFMGMASTFAKDDPKVKEVTYTCTIDCSSCKDKIMKNIPYEKGVKKVEVNIEKKQVTVSFREDKNSVEGIKKAIDKLGYQAEVQKPEEAPSLPTGRQATPLNRGAFGKFSLSTFGMMKKGYTRVKNRINPYPHACGVVLPPAILRDRIFRSKERGRADLQWGNLHCVAVVSYNGFPSFFKEGWMMRRYKTSDGAVVKPFRFKI